MQILLIITSRQIQKLGVQKKRLMLRKCIVTVIWFCMSVCLTFIQVSCCYIFTGSISSSSPAHFKRTTDTPPSISEHEYWSIKGNSPCPRNKRSLNHYVVNTSSATSSQYQDIKESLESERRSKIVTL